MNEVNCRPKHQDQSVKFVQKSVTEVKPKAMLQLEILPREYFQDAKRSYGEGQSPRRVEKKWDKGEIQDG